MQGANQFGNCGCCGECEDVSDDFNRADSPDLGPKWDVIAGDAEIVSNTLRLNSDDTLIEYLDTEWDEADALYVECRLRITNFSSEAEFRAVFNYADADNYLYLAVKLKKTGAFYANAAYLAVYERVGGVDTLLSRSGDVPINPDASWTPTGDNVFQVYYGKDQSGRYVMQASIAEISTPWAICYFAKEVQAPLNARVCLATGALAGSSATIDNFRCVRRQGQAGDCQDPLRLQCTLNTSDHFYNAGQPVADGAYKVVSGVWTYLQGSWQDRGIVTSSPDALLLSETRIPHNNQFALELRTTLRLDASTQQPRIVFNYVDPDNFDYVELTYPNRATVRRRADGNDVEVKTIPGFSTPSLSPTYYSVCITQDRVYLHNGYGFSTGLAAWADLESPASGGRVGLGTGSGHSFATQFRHQHGNWNWLEVRLRYDLGYSQNGVRLCGANPCHEICDYFVPGTEPEFLQVTFPPGTFKNMSSCTDCPSLDGSYLVRHVNGCMWRYVFPESLCGRPLSIEVYPDPYIADDRLRVFLRGGYNVNPLPEWSIPVPKPIDGSQPFSFTADQVRQFTSTQSGFAICHANDGAMAVLESV